MKKTYSVLIGRFQPFHLGHLEIVKKALEQTDELILLFGSHNESRSVRNPLTTSERMKITQASLVDAGIDLERVHMAPLENYTYNLNRWVEEVQDVVRTVIFRKFSPDSFDIKLIGHNKDSSSFYLNLFPSWGSINVENYKKIDATTIRKQMFEAEHEIFHNDFSVANVTPSASNFLKEWALSRAFETLIDEWRIIEDYKKSWTPGGLQTFFNEKGEPVQVQVGPPYPATFQTVDAVVTQSGHILMVTRGAAPGKGLLALPGGFVNVDESLEDAALRELEEETKIKVPQAVLRGSIVWDRTFDDPHRSARGRTITQAFHIDLKPGPLPKVKGSDDAIKAQWIPLTELDGTMIFEDHLQIIRTMTGKK